MTQQSQSPFSVVIAGGGVGALEAVMALREFAGDALSITLVAPNEEFVFVPLSVGEPFSAGPVPRYALAPILEEFGVEHRRDELSSVDPAARTVTTAGGEELAYDALLLALGAKPTPAYEHAVTFEAGNADELLRGLVQDVEGGYSRHVLFLAPPRAAWPLPLYELALQLGRRAWDSQVEVEISLVTPEEQPLAAFGGEVSDAVARLIAAAQIKLYTSAHVQELEKGRYKLIPGDQEIDAHRVVALPELSGPGLPGIPDHGEGFIPIDAETRVRGLERVFAAGDATDFPVKHGSVAAQQADGAAAQIAALAGIEVETGPVRPIVRGVLFTGTEPMFIEGHPSGGKGDAARVHQSPPWPEPGKIVARRLAPYLERAERAT